MNENKSLLSTSTNSIDSLNSETNKTSSNNEKSTNSSATVEQKNETQFNESNFINASSDENLARKSAMQGAIER